MTQSPIGQAALGLRVHSGWAALVVLAGPLGAPAILDRKRIQLADPGIAGSKQPYHAAQRLQLQEADRFVTACIGTSERLAKVAVQAAIDDAIQNGNRVCTSGVLTGSGRPVPTLEKILSSHPLLHTAEGELFRNVIVTACISCGLSVFAVKEKELLGSSSRELGMSEPAIQRHLARLGKTVGSPWRQDEKFATRVAWLALAAGARNGGNGEI